jgi:hypothetical protein
MAPVARGGRHFEHAKPTVSKIGGVHSEVTSLSQQQDGDSWTYREMVSMRYFPEGCLRGKAGSRWNFWTDSVMGLR